MLGKRLPSKDRHTPWLFSVKKQARNTPNGPAHPPEGVLKIEREQMPFSAVSRGESNPVTEPYLLAL